MNGIVMNETTLIETDEAKVSLTKDGCLKLSTDNESVEKDITDVLRKLPADMRSYIAHCISVIEGDIAQAVRQIDEAVRPYDSVYDMYFDEFEDFEGE